MKDIQPLYSEPLFTQASSQRTNGGKKFVLIVSILMLIGIVTYVNQSDGLMNILRKGLGSSANEDSVNDYYLKSKDDSQKHIITAQLERKTDGVNEATQERNLNFQVEALGGNLSRVTIRTNSSFNWKVPDEWIKRLPAIEGEDLTKDYKFSMSKNGKKPFVFDFLYQKGIFSSTYLFTTDSQKLRYSKDRVEFGIDIPSQRIFGFGERTRQFGLTEGDWTAWNRDFGEENFDDGTGGHDQYGSHPFIIWQLNDKKNEFGGAFFLSSNAMNLNVKYLDKGHSALTFTALGGVIEVYFFTATSAISLIEQYSNIVGKPYLPPFWSLGFHLSSWRNENLILTERNYELMLSRGFKVETVWNDAEYMDGYTDFTVDNKPGRPFSGLENFVEDLHKGGRHYVPIIEASIGPLDSDIYKEGKAQQIFIKEHDGVKDLVGKVRTECSYPDWAKKETQNFWNTQFEKFQGKLGFDGIWLDMNEPSDLTNRPPIVSEDDEEILPGVKDLSQYTIPMDAHHFPDVSIPGEPYHYNWHNLYGALEGKATHTWMKSNEKFGKQRKFILSRSTFPGSGRYNQHWLGDNYSKWDQIRLAVSGIYNFNLFQIPFVGADIGGFWGDYTAVEDSDRFLTRFHQVGAFFPFSRNHNGKNVAQEPFVLPDEQMKFVRNAFDQRYSLLRYFYINLQLAERNGTPFFLPTYLHFPEDSETFSNFEDHIMIGKDLLVTPVLDNDDFRTVSIPKGNRWYHHQNNKVQEGLISLEETWEYINTFQREGTVLVTQDGAKAQVTNDLLNMGLQLQMFPDEKKHRASGFIIVANGQYEDEETQEWTVTYADNTVKFNLEAGKRDITRRINENELIDKITIYDAEHLASISSDLFVCASTNHGTHFYLQGLYDLTTQVLTIDTPGHSEVQMDEIDEIRFGLRGRDVNPCATSIFVVGDVVEETDERLQVVIEPKEIDNNEQYKFLLLTAEIIDEQMIRVHITEKDNDRFEVPFEQQIKKGDDPDPDPPEPTLRVRSFLNLPGKGQNFTFSIMNPHTGRQYFTLDAFTFEDQYIKIDTDVRGKNLFGYGERVHDFFLKDGTYEMWAYDNPAQYDEGRRDGNQGYGVHPVYFAQPEGTKNFFGVLNMNANAQQVTLFGEKTSIRKIQHELTGGVVDLYIMMEDSYENVVKHYHSLIGKPYLPAFWSMGWHQSKYGYKNTQELEDVLDGYRNANIPIEVIWSDIDYMDKYQDFTIDSQNYGNLGKSVQEWHERGIKWVPIMDAGIGVQEGNQVYKTGIEQDLYIKSPSDNKPLVGEVWPGDAVFPDFLKEETGVWWRDAFQSLYKQAQFDGIWLDMNEAADFVPGQAHDEQIVSPSIRDRMPMNPGNHDINEKSLQVDAYHLDDPRVTEYNYHSLFGHFQTIETSKMFTSAQHAQRYFILTRSTFVGTGRYASHWLGDNHSNYESMRTTTAGIYLFNVFGFSHVGGDICGFMGDSDPELCTRWTNVGAMYPFARNHNSINSKPQEPFTFENSYKNVQKTAISTRYSLAGYLYNHMIKASRDGGVVWKPQFVHYPEDEAAYELPEENIMIGNDLKMCMHYGTDEEHEFYFPNGFWTNLHTGQTISGSQQVKLSTKFNEMNLYMRPSSIIQWQNIPTNPFDFTTADLLETQTSLKINFGEPYVTANGEIVIDDGLSSGAEPIVVKVTGLFTEPTFRRPLDPREVVLEFESQSSESQFEGKVQELGFIDLYQRHMYKIPSEKPAVVYQKDGQEGECTAMLHPIVPDVLTIDCSSLNIKLTDVQKIEWKY